MISIGAAATISFTCDDTSTAMALGSGDLPVLGTPKVVAIAEEAAVAALIGSLEDGATTVGTRIVIDHLAPTPIGGTVHACATVTAVDERRVDFAIDVTDGEITVARGIHTRVVVDRTRFLAKM